jgi:hypothetical protein
VYKCISVWNCIVYYQVYCRLFEGSGIHDQGYANGGYRDTGSEHTVRRSEDCFWGRGAASHISLTGGGVQTQIAPKSAAVVYSYGGAVTSWIYSVPLSRGASFQIYKCSNAIQSKSYFVMIAVSNRGAAHSFCRKQMHSNLSWYHPYADDATHCVRLRWTFFFWMWDLLLYLRPPRARLPPPPARPRPPPRPGKFKPILCCSFNIL